MPQKVRIALDAMGGDFGASVVVPGAALALTRHQDVEFLLFGDSTLINAQLEQHPALKAISRVVPRRHRHQHGREAQPGAAAWPQVVVHVARDRRGQEGRGRCCGLGRQHRCAHGHGPIEPTNAARDRSSGDRCCLADCAR